MKVHNFSYCELESKVEEELAYFMANIEFPKKLISIIFITHLDSKIGKIFNNH